MTLAMHALPVTLTPANQRSYWCINGVNDTGKVDDIYCPVSMTLVMSPVLLTPVTCFASVIDTGKYMLCQCH
jgi:hypothetical protein